MTVRFPDAPLEILALPVDHRGFPVPWFVTWFDGVPDFRIADRRKWPVAVARCLCWICGQELEMFGDFAFVIGPMCAVNRTSSEPPSHPDCARFAAKACPFLVNPRMRRNEKDMPEHVGPGGVMIERNPGVALVWTTTTFTIFPTDNGPLIEIGPASAAEWFAEGRAATRQEVLHSIETGIPLLVAEAQKDPEPELALRELERMKNDAFTLLPAAAA